MALRASNFTPDLKSWNIGCFVQGSNAFFLEGLKRRQSCACSAPLSVETEWLSHLSG
jgi:hypothetical protein